MEKFVTNGLCWLLILKNPGYDRLGSLARTFEAIDPSQRWIYLKYRKSIWSGNREGWGLRPHPSGIAYLVSSGDMQAT